MTEVGQAHLFEPPPKENPKLGDRFGIVPFSVLNARGDDWQKRKRDWMNLGLVGELPPGAKPLGAAGREENLLNFSEAARDPSVYKRKAEREARVQFLQDSQGLSAEQAEARVAEEEKLGAEGRPADLLGVGESGHSGVHGTDAVKKYAGGGAWANSGTSLFDPVLCELAYRWFCPPGGRILDPFAGGSVRGILAACLEHPYFGVDLRPEQVEANFEARARLADHLSWEHPPEWVVGDARDIPAICSGEQFDFVFSCPPYFDLEVYSEDPRDLSRSKTYAAFRALLSEIVFKAVEKLAPNSFACFVVGDVRDKKTGCYVGLVRDTISAFEIAGAMLYNEAILVTSAGSLPLRVGRSFVTTRKLGKTHQNVLVFCKGDSRKAADKVPVEMREVGGLEAEQEPPPPSERELALREAEAAARELADEVDPEGAEEPAFEGDEPL